MANAIAGTAYLSVNGRRVQLVGEFTWQVSAVQRESLMGMDGYHGRKEKPRPGQIKAKLRDGQDVSVADLANNPDSPITAQLANGKVIVGRNMYTTEVPTVDTEEGTIDITWEGPDVSEQ